MADVSVIIPARNEMFLARTIQCVLENSEADTEVVAMLDGYWPDPPIVDHPKVTVVHHSVPIGQRAATNEGVRLSTAQFVMKLDAHCALDKGFDRKLMAGCQNDWTVVPQMYNLHAFNWKCGKCGKETYQGKTPSECIQCKTKDPQAFEMVMLWRPRARMLTCSWRFDSELHFQYWHEHKKRPETRRGAYIETMSFIGACWFMHRDRYWELDGLDEKHGSWGQVGTEVACKSWLIGGKLLTAKATWFAHMFRTGNFGGFPYPISGNAQERARIYSRDFWRNNRWPKQKYPLSWLVEKFWPVPGWKQEDLDAQKERE